MLTQQIKADMTTAMKARDSVKVNTLRGAMAAFTNELVSKGRKPTEELTDTEAQAVLKRLAKQRKEAAEAFTTGNRPELAEKELQELTIIETYLPQTVSREDIEKVVRAKITELGVTDAAGAGKLTGVIMKEFALTGQAGAADGNVVKEIIQSVLSS
jgi:hypothetical protein